MVASTKRDRSPLGTKGELRSNLLDDASSLKRIKTAQPNKQVNGIGLVTPPISDYLGINPTADGCLSALYSDSTVAKIWGVAQRALNKSAPPTLYPEFTKPGGTAYVYRESEFWTSGFFPGSLYLLLERQRKYPQIAFPSSYSGPPQTPHTLQLQYACKWWTVNLHKNSRLNTTHDLSFMISPWARKAWDIENDSKAYETLITSARTLATRYGPKTKCLRSWDTCITKRYSFTDPDLDFLVIIDNMLNLDLLFWAAAELRDSALRDIAISHAESTQTHHIRPDFSTTHVVNFDQATGAVKAKMTNQGYDDSSCWSRGQAWAITGFAQTYTWTHDPSFLATARGCADYFLAHLPPSGVPPWDFSAPATSTQPTDTSAGIIACYGMLLLHNSLVALGKPSPYLKGALHILSALCTTQLSPPATFHSAPIVIPSAEHGTTTESGALEVEMGNGAETILEGSTINNYEFAPRQWADHGLVYADYYFLLVGNLLLDMGIGGRFTGKA
ncbi:hypothetical protein V496_05603 [Pseudogymnoascus sp. VKM F-4515 (FW-2607)]|nr:hypothetical protein V496_05603 [Pseudogymnoascus sp. VKM F-4515 (FW-2607)]KFY83347.1 hypothetical protein V498_08138 [Pseudogymnoascus sp. VKM F-4517 (FW-2822)]